MTTRPYQGVTKGAGDTDSSWSLRVYVKRRFYGQGLQPNTELTVFVRISCLRLCKQYSNLCQAFKMELFAIIVNSINYHSQNSRPRKGTIYCSSLPLPPAQKHSDISLEIYMWDDYHVFLIALCVTSRLVLDEIQCLIELLFDWLMMQCLFLFVYLMI